MQYIIFLRGINVGGRNIKMAELKTCLEKAGFENVQTILQTGNALISSKEKNSEKLTTKIEITLSKEFSYPAKVLAISTQQLKKINTSFPFSNAEENFHKYVVFSKDGFEKELVQNAPLLDSKIEKIRAGNEVIYWCVQKGETLNSAFGKYISKASSKHFLTTRNLNTLHKIVTKADENL